MMATIKKAIAASAIILPIATNSILLAVILAIAAIDLLSYDCCYHHTTRTATNTNTTTTST